MIPKCPEIMRIKDLLNDDKNFLYDLYDLIKISVIKNVFESKELLSLMYYTHSGEKLVPYTKLTEEQISNMIWAYYRRKWERLGEQFNDLDYSPIDNVDIKTDISVDNRKLGIKQSNDNKNNIEDIDRINQDNYKRSKDEFNNRYRKETEDDLGYDETQTTNNEVEKNSRNNFSFTDNNIYGFNSTKSSNSEDNIYNEGENADRGAVTSEDGRTDSYNNSHRDENINENNKINEQEGRQENGKEKRGNIENNTQTEKNNETNLNDEKEVKKGRDGRFTTQQMLEEEYEYRKHILIDIIFDDIDRLITIPCY